MSKSCAKSSKSIRKSDCRYEFVEVKKLDLNADSLSKSPKSQSYSFCQKKSCSGGKDHLSDVGTSSCRISDRKSNLGNNHDYKQSIVDSNSSGNSSANKKKNSFSEIDSNEKSGNEKLFIKRYKRATASHREKHNAERTSLILTQNGVNTISQLVHPCNEEQPHFKSPPTSSRAYLEAGYVGKSQQKRTIGDKENEDELALSSSKGLQADSDHNKSHNGKHASVDYVWKFEKHAMWTISTISGKRMGCLLFNCQNLEHPPLSCPAIKYEMAFKFFQADSKLLRIVLESHGLTEVHSNNFNLYWGNSHFNPNEMKQLQEWQKVNHFPRSAELTRKDRLYMNIKRMQRQFGVKLFDFVPTSFVLPTEYRDFCDIYLRERGTWIVKPVASSQGKGIYLVSQIDQVPTDETAMVCRYLDSPLLVNGYKCDLRLYVCVTSLDPLLVYMYEEGLVRLASVKYQHGKSLWNPCVHLTNYSVNKFHSNYIQNEDPEIDDMGNKWSLSAFLKHLKAKGIDTGALMRRIEDVILKSILSASYQMTSAANMFVPHVRNCFELYGFDVLIDSNLKPWILEVNLSPSLNMDQPLDLKIKSAMLTDLLSLIGLPICNPNTAKYSSKHSVYRKLPNLRYSTESYERSHFSGRGNDRFVPSWEESKIFRQVREETERKGGWARIFPTPDSWAMYGGLQEYDSPLNLVLHHHLYPNVQRSSRTFRVAPQRLSSVSSSGLVSSLERLSCYERALPKGLASLKSKLSINLGNKENKTVEKDFVKLKASVIDGLEGGLTFSKYQARMAFSVYLQHIQRRLMIGCDQERQSEVVYKFIRSASRTLQIPVGVQAPSKTLPNEARAVIISKQLGDFIQAYTKETQMYHDQNISVSSISLSSQCDTSSSLATPSDPKAYPCLDEAPEREMVESERGRCDQPLHAKGLNVSCGSLPKPGKHQLSASSISLLSTTSLPESTRRPLPTVEPHHQLNSSSTCTSSTTSKSHCLPLSHSRQPLATRDSVPSVHSSSSSFGSTLPSSKPSLESASTSSVGDEVEEKKSTTFLAKMKRLRSDIDSGIHSLCDVSKTGDVSEESSTVSRIKPADFVAMDVYRAFLSSAKESDLEEVLALQTKLRNSASMFLDSRRLRTSRSSSQTSLGSQAGQKSPSPHGTPKRVKKQHATRDSSVTTPISAEPQTITSAGCAPPVTPPTATTQSTCCLFGNILKASLKGTNSSFT